MTKRKQPRKALWVQCFKDQHQKLSRASRGFGVKSQSANQKARLACYGGIRELFLQHHPYCQACCRIDGVADVLGLPSTDVHHMKSRAGLLLFDVRHWLAVCRKCHTFIHQNPAEAKKLGLIKAGWNMEDKL